MSNTSLPSTSRAAIALAFAAVYLIWGSTYLAIRVGIETLPPFTLAAVRFLIAGVILYAILRLRGATRPTRAQWLRTAGIGTLLLCGGNGLVCAAEEFVPSGIAALFVATVPVFMVMLDRWWNRATRVSPLTAVGITMGLGGTVVLVSVDGGSGTPMHLGGALLLLGAALSWSIGSVVARGKIDLPRSPVMATAMEMIGGSVALGIVAVVLGEPATVDRSAISTESLVALAYLIVFGSIIALSAYVWLLGQASVASVSTYAFVNPVVALFLGWWWKEEPFGVGTAIASVLILAGVVMIHIARTAGARRARLGAVCPRGTSLLPEASQGESTRA